MKKYRDSQTPEAIKKKIEKEKLLTELEIARKKRSELNKGKYNIRIGGD